MFALHHLKIGASSQLPLNARLWHCFGAQITPENFFGPLFSKSYLPPESTLLVTNIHSLEIKNVLSN